MTNEQPLPPASRPGPRGIGALLHTDVEHVDLGEHSGRVLRARVEHRTLRLGLGRGWSTAVTLGRRRATSVEVTPAPRSLNVSSSGAPSGERYDVVIPRPVDPWPQAVRRIVGLTVAGWIAVRIVHRLRGRRRHEGALE